MNMNTDEDHIPANGTATSRRALLRGALVAGCSLLLPAALLGCDSKTSGDAADAAPDGGPDTTDTDATKETAKMSQESVQYQAQPKGDQQCNGCLHFIAKSNTCQVVEGSISPNGWSTMWTPRA